LTPSFSTDQKESSVLTFLQNSPSIILSLPLMPTTSFLSYILTSSILASVLSGNSINTVTSSSVYCHLYLSVQPPLPGRGVYLSLFSFSLSSSPSAFFSSSFKSPDSNLAFLAASSLIILSASSSVISST